MFIKPKEQYKGLTIAASAGTHQAVAEAVQRHCGPDSLILEMGAYSGAMIERLRDLGFKRILAADLDNHLSIKDVPHVSCDFNSDFSSRFAGQRVNCIVVSEVIEHLDDPRAFLTQCVKLLDEDGVIIITTPNIAFYEGRIKFMLKGELWGFGAKNYTSMRHITPISVEQFPLILQEAGLSTLELFTAASTKTNLGKLVYSVIWLPMRLMLGPFVLGETLLCVGQKSANEKGRFSSKDLWTKQSPNGRND